MNYQPLPGTGPARAVAYLRSLPEGMEISTAELADAIDYDHRSLASHLALSKKHGLVISRIPKGALYTMWSAGKGVPLTDPINAEEDEPLGAASATPPNTASSVFDIARGASEPDAPPPKATTEAAQVVGKESREGHADQRPPAQAVRFALWSDGALEIRRTGVDHFVISPEDTERLFDYLDVLRTKEVPA